MGEINGVKKFFKNQKKVLFKYYAYWNRVPLTL